MKETPRQKIKRLEKENEDLINVFDIEAEKVHQAAQYNKEITDKYNALATKWNALLLVVRG